MTDEDGKAQTLATRDTLAIPPERANLRCWKPVSPVASTASSRTRCYPRTIRRAMHRGLCTTTTPELLTGGRPARFAADGRIEVVVGFFAVPDGGA